MREARSSAAMQWLVNGIVIMPGGLTNKALGLRAGRIAAIEQRAPRDASAIDARGRYISPGFVDLHIWGDPQRVAREEVKSGTTSFLTAVGPESPERLVNHFVQLDRSASLQGARCLGIHLEGPFLNPLRAGALASRWLRPPTSRELRQLMSHATARLKLMTIAPEIPRGLQAIRWCVRHGIVVSLGHSDASDAVAQRAIRAGARAVTHVYNGMRPLHHRDPGLLGEVLTDDRLMAMVILDGVHVDPVAFQLLWRCKGPHGIALVTDSIRHQGYDHAAKGLAAPRMPKALASARQASGAFYARPGILAGSRLTLMKAVRNAVKFGNVSLVDAVRMASLNPARLVGLERDLGSIEVGKRADLVVFDRDFRVAMTLVGGSVVYEAKRLTH